MAADIEVLRGKANAAYSAIFGGRIARTTFAIRTAILAATIFILVVPLDTILAPSSKTFTDAYTALFFVMLALCSLGFVSAYVKRLHDIGLRGYWALPALIGIPAAVGYVGDAYQAYRHDLDPDSFPDLAGFNDAQFAVALALPLLLALWRGQEGENRFGRPPEAVEHFSASKFNIAAVIGAAAILIPTCIYAGLFQPGVWVGRGSSAPSMPMIDSMSSGRLLAKCWNIKGVGAGTGKGDLSGVYRDGYGDSVLDFVVRENGEIDVVPAGAAFSKAYRADGFDIHPYGLADTDGQINVGERSRFLIAAVYDGSATPEGNVNFTTFSFAKTGEIWPEWQMIMSTGMNLGPQPLLEANEQARGRLMVADCVVR
jgi:uncharacterized membrane protein YhaH (DUF805 family)